MKKNLLLSDNTMPCRSVQSIKFFLYEHCDIPFEIMSLKGVRGDFDGSLLHFFRHCVV
jgi:hypothetical protein